MTPLSVKSGLHLEGVPVAGTSARIGPNAVLQTLAALDELEGAAVRQGVESAARARGLPATLPPGMIPEAHFVALIQATREALPVERAEAVLRQSGLLTARYVRANRIPAAARVALGLLPARLALPLLLRAIAGHSWTFTGAGRFEVRGGHPGTLVLEGAPTSRALARPPEGRMACGYYEAAFQELLGLAARGVHVHETGCQASRAGPCIFEVRL